MEWFGREIEGVGDRICGYRMEMIEIRDKKMLMESGESYHAILVADPAGLGVPGIVLDLTPEEHQKVSALGLDWWDQVEVKLESGLKATIHVMNPKKVAETV